MPPGVIIDFEADPVALATQEPWEAPAVTQEDAGVLSHVLLELPTRLVIGGVTIFDGSARLPIIGMAHGGLYHLLALPQLGRTDIILPGDGLRLRMDGNDVIVTYPSLKRTGRVPYDELLQAWKQFSDRVRAFLLEEFPAFRDHPELGAWFRGEEP